MAGASMLAVECQRRCIERRLETRYLDEATEDLDDALATVPGARTVADAVLLLGEADGDDARLKDGIAALASRYHAGAVGLCAVAEGEEQAWFQALVRELYDASRNAKPRRVFNDIARAAVAAERSGAGGN